MHRALISHCTNVESDRCRRGSIYPANCTCLFGQAALPWTVFRSPTSHPPHSNQPQTSKIRPFGGGWQGPGWKSASLSILSDLAPRSHPITRLVIAEVMSPRRISFISWVPVSSPGSWGSVLFLQTSRKLASKPHTGQDPF